MKPGKRGMGRKTSNIVSARFTNYEIEQINNICLRICSPRSKLIHDVIIAGLDLKEPNAKSPQKDEYIWSRTISCNACMQDRPGFGSEYYYGDICRCEDCKNKNIPLNFSVPATRLRGIIGFGELQQYKGQNGQRPI